MSGITTSTSSSDNFWYESSTSVPLNLKHSEKKRNEAFGRDFLESIDESPDFHDPFSDLNLFLAQKIKTEMHSWENHKKWSIKLQEELIQKITPEFQKKFPKYRLGISALKKTWEKVSYYSQQIRSQKEAITQDGKLNVPFLIRENLKQYFSFSSSEWHPYHYAHQLAMKISECIATIDGTRPKHDHLTKIVWSQQKHLLSGQCIASLKSPYDEYDKIDKLVVKTILEITAKEPLICQRELEHKVIESLKALQELPCFASLETMTSNVSALLAEKLYPTPTHFFFLSQQKNAIDHFIRRQVQLCKKSGPSLKLSELVRRVLALYALASQMPKSLKEEEIKAAIQASYPIMQEQRPELDQSIYAFISAESVLMKTDEYCHSIDYVTKTIAQAYEEAKLLPHLKDKKELELLEIFIWKILNESEGLLEKLPYVVGQKIEEEIANILIDNPELSFASIVHLTVQFFKKTKELALQKKWSDIERKVHLWTIQSDMLCRFIRVEAEKPILKCICEKWNELKSQESQVSHLEFVSRVSIEYLKKHPHLAICAPQVNSHIWILYKYAWYALFAEEKESSLDRFIQWHLKSIHFSSPAKPPKEHILTQISEICQKRIPLIPIDFVSCA